MNGHGSDKPFKRRSSGGSKKTFERVVMWVVVAIVAWSMLRVVGVFAGV